MARIPEHELEQLKSVDLVRLVELDGLALKRIGKDLACVCPFHDGDREPSLIVSPGTNLFHCFGCGAAGSPIDWVMRRRGVSFRRAVELLRAELGDQSGPPGDGVNAVPKMAASRIVAPLLPSADDAALLAEVVGFYSATLKTSPEALAYLAKRGLTHPDLIDQFQLGYANRTLAYRLPEKQVAAGAKVRGQLQRLGVLRTSGHEHFQGSLVVPVFDAAGQVAEIYARKIADKQREGTPLHLYLPGPHRGVFNLAGWRGSETVILCEALIDALTFWCAGLSNVTSAFGVGGFTDELLQAFEANSVKRVLIAYDADEAGDRAAEALALRLQAVGIEAYRVVFPRGMDANAFALEATPAAESLGLLLEQARPMGAARSEAVVGAAMAAIEAQPRVVEERSTDEAQVEPTTSEVQQVPPLAAAVAGEIAAMAAPTEADPPSIDPAGTLVVEQTAQQIVIAFGPRRYRVRGLGKCLSAETLKINLLVSAGDLVHVDTFDLYAAKPRAGYVRQAASALSVEDAVIERDLARLLLKLGDLQNAAIEAAVKPQSDGSKAPAELSVELREAAVALLRDPTLIERIVRDVAAIGVVGEDSNALVGYLACVSRKLDKPLAVLIQSTSAAGKSTLMDALLSLMPDAERVHYSAMTGQSLFYLGEGDLKHKILAIAEEEGVRQASYALKLLQSQGELTIASTGKDPLTGKLVTEEYRVEGPVMLFLTSTAIDLDEELLNRCLVLTINESREQTEAIHRRQRQARTLAGLVATKEAEAIRQLHRAAQTLLRPVAVVNPYAEALTFRSESTRMRRDHQKYLTLIDAIAFLCQHQRPLYSTMVGGQAIEYVEVTLADIELANRLAHEVLGRSLDELPPQTRRMLGVLTDYVREQAIAQAIAPKDLRFTRKDIRPLSGITDTALRLHLERLVELDYLVAHRGGFGSRFVYELAFDGNATMSAAQMVGLIDVESLRSGTSSHPKTQSSHPSKANLAPTSHPENTPFAPTLQAGENPPPARPDAVLLSLAAAVPETAVLRTQKIPAQRKPNGILVPHTNGAALPA